MAKMKSSEVSKWLSLCKLSVEERKIKQPWWGLLRQYFRGLQVKQLNDTLDEVTVNMVYGHVKVVVPSVYSRNPKIFFEANRPSSTNGARLAEAITERDMQALKVKQTVKRILNDVVLLGTGFSKTTYEVDDDGEEAEQDKQTVDQLLERFRDYPSAAPVEARGKVVIPYNGPRVVRVPPDDLAFALGAHDMGDPGFIGQHVRKRMADVMNDPWYKNKSQLKPSGVVSESLRGKLPAEDWSRGVSDFTDAIDLWEIWDPNTGTYFTLAEGHDLALREPADNPFPYMHPFTKLIFTPIDSPDGVEEMWGFSEVEPWLPQQDEFNSIRTQQHMHLKRYNRKYIARFGAFRDDEAKSEFQAGEDGMLVELNVATGTSLDDTVKVLQDGEISADVYRVGDRVENDIEKIGGVPRSRRGDLDPEVTATAETIAEGSASDRDNERIDAIGDFVIDIMVHKVLAARRALTPGQNIVRITGNPSDQQDWDVWAQDDLDIDAEARVEYGSTRPINEQSRQAKAIALYDRAIQNPTVNPQAAFAKFADQMGERNVTDYFLQPALLQMQLVNMVVGKQLQQQKGQAVAAAPGQEGGGTQPPETEAELSGRAAPSANTGEE